MIGLLLALYPARWRRRYGEEFQAVLESRPLGPFDVADVLLGALDARLTPFRLAGVAETGGHLMLLRLGGYGAILGGALWFAGIALASSGAGPRSLGGALALLGNAGILIALIGLSAFQAHRAPVLTWAAFLIPAVGAVASMVGMGGLAMDPEGSTPLVGSLAAWDVWMGGLLATFVGSILFGAVTYRARVLSSRAAAGLVGTSIATIVVGVASMGLIEPGGWLAPLAVAFLAAFAGSWMALGASALRRGPLAAAAPA
jgi:hypothetical protein